MNPGTGADVRVLFVYGTLRSGGVSAHLMAGARSLGLARTGPGFALVSMGWYPALVMRSGAETVVGELFEVPVSALPSLDAYEDVPTLYTRVVIPVASEAGFDSAEAYVIHSEHAQGRPIIASGDWFGVGGRRRD